MTNKTVSKLWERLLSMPKSFYVSAKLCGVKAAFYLPVQVRYNCVIRSLKGKAVIDFNIAGAKTALLNIGFIDVGIYDKRYSRPIIEIDGIIKINGVVKLGVGSRISVGPKGSLTIGSNFAATAHCTIVCGKQINIGNDVLIGWDVMLMDTDFHPIIDVLYQTRRHTTGEINIGNHVWICTKSIILKNTTIPNDCVIGASSCVSRKFANEHSLIAGSPACEKKTNISWSIE